MLRLDNLFPEGFTVTAGAAACIQNTSALREVSQEGEIKRFHIDINRRAKNPARGAGNIRESSECIRSLCKGFPLVKEYFKRLIPAVVQKCVSQRRGRARLANQCFTQWEMAVYEIFISVPKTLK